MLADLTLRLTVSVGMTAVDAPGTTAAEVLAAADAEMYARKRHRELRGRRPAAGASPA